MSSKSEECKISEIITFLVGGFHTTANLLCWLFYYICKHPSVQEKIRAEVNTVARQGVTCNDVDKLTYTKQVMNETLRISCLAPYAGRFAHNDMKICGYHIPAQTPIILALGAVLADDKLWNNPNVFDPDRFSKQNQKHRDVLQFVPFGFAGRRVCPGMAYAHLNVLLLVASIIQNFDVKLKNPDMVTVPVHQLVTCPKDDIMLKLQEIMSDRT